MTQDVDRSKLIDGCGQALGETCLSCRSIAAVATLNKLRPLLGLRGIDERVELKWIEPQHTVEVIGLRLQIAALLQ